MEYRPIGLTQLTSAYEKIDFLCLFIKEWKLIIHQSIVFVMELRCPTTKGKLTIDWKCNPIYKYIGRKLRCILRFRTRIHLRPKQFYVKTFFFAQCYARKETLYPFLFIAQFHARCQSENGVTLTNCILQCSMYQNVLDPKTRAQRKSKTWHNIDYTKN